MPDPLLPIEDPGSLLPLTSIYFCGMPDRRNRCLSNHRATLHHLGLVTRCCFRAQVNKVVAEVREELLACVEDLAGPLEDFVTTTLARRPRTRARPHWRFVPPLVHFAPDSLTYSAPLFPTRQCSRILPRTSGGR